ncbi:hypothetical protein CPB84DRAFT_1790790 [Gymnopilus junonius]|uniref:Inhibitor I9 domain-containing protein n=1 Tax=Gymnopilus junonius TaxID=109634 RepID=A0A9P5THR1_GYMJU|nr:hypothetical protein CPB84DRAFT_1790790 [Gymnopilus junonius]
MKPGYSPGIAMAKIPPSAGLIVGSWDSSDEFSGFAGVFKNETLTILRAMPEVKSVYESDIFYLCSS